MKIACCSLLLVQSANAFSIPSGRAASPLVSHSSWTTTSSSWSAARRRGHYHSWQWNTASALYGTTNEGTSDDAITPDKNESLTSQLAPELERNKINLLIPLAQALEDSTGGWALSYADLAPETDETPIGRGFLATNLAYTVCGLLLVQSGNVLLGVLTELASVASFAYHFAQLKLGKNQPLVRVALLVDYVVAASTLLAALVYIIQVGVQNVPLEGIIASILAVVFLFLSWVWEEGLPYVFNHGMWHLLGAYAGFMIGQGQSNTGWWH